MKSSVAFVVLALAACGTDTPPVEPLFAADYETTYQEVRGCERSGDHDLNFVKIYTDAAATTPWVERMAAFPVGAVILKPEYADNACTDLINYTAMRKESTAAVGDWTWQKLEADLTETPGYDLGRCESCHSSCPGGYDWTCTEIRGQ